jgi:hypothetical protein
MYEGDLADTLLDAEKSPEWDSERTKLIYAWPAEQELWDQYGEIRRTRGKEAATAFYAARRAAMDRGASVGWPDRFDAKAGELSAVQHAVNLRLRTGPEGFATEYQNEPALVQTADTALTVDQVLAKVSGHKRGEVPAACTKLTMFIDIHDQLLYYMVCAWAEDFGGQIVEYGTLPQQNRSRAWSRAGTGCGACSTRTLTPMPPTRPSSGSTSRRGTRCGTRPRSRWTPARSSASASGRRRRRRTRARCR